MTAMFSAYVLLAHSLQLGQNGMRARGYHAMEAAAAEHITNEQYPCQAIFRSNFRSLDTAQMSW